MTTVYAFEAGSLADRCLRLLAMNHEDEYAVQDLAGKFNVHLNAIRGVLRNPVAQGLVSYSAAADVPCYQATAELLQLLPASPATLATSGLPAPRSNKRARTPLPDLDKVQIKHDVPIPPPGRGDLGKTSVYGEIWSRMKPGSCVELPDRQALALMAYVKKHKQTAVIRKLGDGTRGVWRQA
jgi:hypothetical protein